MNWNSIAQWTYYASRGLVPKIYQLAQFTYQETTLDKPEREG